MARYPSDVACAHAERLLVATIKAGCSRQVGAAVVAALFCALHSNSVEELPANVVHEELEVRLAAIKQALAKSVSADPISGTLRAARNLAVHAKLGEGAEVVRAALAAPQSSRRGGRRRRRASLPPSNASTTESLDRVSSDTVTDINNSKCEHFDIATFSAELSIASDP